MMACKCKLNGGYEWGLVFSVICPYFLVFAVILAIFLMFTVSGRNTVKCLECFSFFSLRAL